MIQALGYSATRFDPFDPGRLCRGRERWITPYPRDVAGAASTALPGLAAYADGADDEEDEDVHEDGKICRLVISGAAFKDDAAAEAKRGLPFSKADTAQVIAALFPRTELLAFMEDGHPADIPEDAQAVEMYTGNRAGGRTEELLVRWRKPVKGVRELRAVLGADPAAPRVAGFLHMKPEVDLDDEDAQAARDALFLLVGLSTLDSPPARFQPAALPEVLQYANAVILLHRDKGGPALGIYSHTPVRAEDRLTTLAAKHDTLLVSFGIPPMLARWDRALYELRERWDEEELGPFPVPRAPEGQAWAPRRKHRHPRRDRKPTPEPEVQPEVEVEVDEAPAEPASAPLPSLDDDDLFLVEDDAPADSGEE